jgi:hypothetical protein
MTDEHKAALAQGRDEGRIVRLYLEALEATRPRRGRPRTIDTVRNRLEAVVAEIDDADALSRLQLVQERIDLTNELAAMEAVDDLALLEDDFVRVAESYGERKGITYAAWREVGVPPEVLRDAGIGRNN